ncbi:MAG: class II aldolase/adducin family protein [Akkermansiaceae bacterium]|nr:class II aldolase/adducin family protein [Akkermansiaceae bacterium]NNM29218.1 class II aldolase/adducin family protein [Akkermansiaceae bacterium]
MKKVLTGKDVEALLRAGKGVDSIPDGVLLTPTAKDAIKEAGTRRRRESRSSVASDEPTVPDYEFRWNPGNDPQSPGDIRDFFHSREVEELKHRMCDIGRRMWERGYTDGNGGNLTIRVGDNLVLCTPTLISKGFMKPEDMALIDLEGNQLAGRRKRTSECLTHMAIMKRQPKAKACCHAHPPHATAFAVAGVQPPTCMIPEAEVFLGQIGMAEYQTPGTPANAVAVGEAAIDHMAVLMLNHGVITWGKDIEDSYWKMENTDAYCQTVLMATQLKGSDLLTITGGQAKELIDLRASLGMEDKRADWKECELCDNSEFRPGVVCQIPHGDGARTNGGGGERNEDAEAVVRQVTNEILTQLNS